MALATVVEIKLRAKRMLPNQAKTVISPPGARKVLLGVLIDRERPRLSKEFRNNLETHIYALTHASIGTRAHKAKRGFVSTIGMRNHITGLLSFAHQVDPDYAGQLHALFAKVDWSK
jgi:RNA-directed DNA polymerase